MMRFEPNLTDQDYELLSAYLDGELSAEEQASLEARLGEDLLMQRELEALRQTSALIGQLPILQAPRNFTLEPAAPKVIEFPAAQARRRNLPILLSAAAAVFVVTIGLAVLLSGPRVGNIQSDLAGALSVSATSNQAVAAAPSATATEEPLQTYVLGETQEDRAQGNDLPPQQAQPKESPTLSFTAAPQEPAGGQQSDDGAAGETEPAVEQQSEAATFGQPAETFNFSEPQSTPSVELFAPAVANTAEEAQFPEAALLPSAAADETALEQEIPNDGASAARSFGPSTVELSAALRLLLNFLLTLLFGGL